jgi:predicted aspartyl protease
MRNGIARGLLLLLLCRPGVCIFADQPDARRSPIRFKLERNFLITVPVFVNGAGPFDFMLDTGTNTTILHPEFARQLGLRPIDRLLLVTVAGSRAVPRSRLERLTLGPRTVTGVEVLWTDLGEIRALAPRICGVLGQNFLSRFNYLIDYAGRRIEFEEGDELERVLRGARLTLETDEDQALVVAQPATPGRKALRFALDSGTTTLVLFAPAVERLAPDIVSDGGPFGRAATIAGASRLVMGRLGHLRLGSEVLTDLPAALVTAARVEDGLLPLSLFRAVYFNHRVGFVILNPLKP